MADDTTCKACRGTGKVPLVNVWEIKRYFLDGKPLPDELPMFRETPCAECRNEDFVGYIHALLERHGQPFSDCEVEGVGYYEHPEHGRVAAFTSEHIEGDDDEEDGRPDV